MPPCPCDDCIEQNLRKYTVKEGPSQPVRLDHCSLEAINVVIETVINFLRENLIESYSLIPLCDETTGDIVGYMAIVKNEDAEAVPEQVWFDLDGNPLPAAPANAGPCPDVEYQLMVLCDDNGPFLRLFDVTDITNNSDFELDGTPYTTVGAANTCPPCAIPYDQVCYEVGDELRSGFLFYDCNYVRVLRDGETNDLIDPPYNIVDCPPLLPQMLVGYIERCEVFENTLQIKETGIFDGTANTITITNPAALALLKEEIEAAQKLQTEQEKHGEPVTPFVIYTDNDEIYSFEPLSVTDISGGVITVDPAGVIAWGIDQTEEISYIEYSVFDNCTCQQVKLIQEYDKITGATILLDIIDPLNFDTQTGEEDTILPLTFGMIGPYPGGCPEEPQVISIKTLCCNNDLVEGTPDIANQRLAWLDGSDPSLMLDAIGGTPIAGNDGDEVFEVQDKLDPGVAPSFRLPAQVGEDLNTNPPTYQSNVYNDLSVLNFNANNRERLRLDTNNPPGSSFTLFYLVSAPGPVGALDGNACILGVGSNSSDGDSYHTLSGSWQLARDSDQNAFIFRLDMDDTEYAAGVDPIEIVSTPSTSNLQRPSNPHPTFANLEIQVATGSDFFNNQLHLITATFDNTTAILSIYFDGQLRSKVDFSGFPLTVAAMGSDYFRLFGNRFGEAFLSGNLAELYFTDVALTADETATINAYLVCKWGIDPSLTAGGQGDLTIAETGTFGNPTPFVEITRGNGFKSYLNTLTRQEYPLPPTPGLGYCSENCPCGQLAGNQPCETSTPIVVCYDDNGDIKSALAFYDCDRNLIEYRDAETNDVLIAPVAIVPCEENQPCETSTPVSVCYYEDDQTDTFTFNTNDVTFEEISPTEIIFNFRSVIYGDTVSYKVRVLTGDLSLTVNDPIIDVDGTQGDIQITKLTDQNICNSLFGVLYDSEDNDTINIVPTPDIETPGPIHRSYEYTTTIPDQIELNVLDTNGFSIRGLAGAICGVIKTAFVFFDCDKNPTYYDAETNTELAPPIDIVLCEEVSTDCSTSTPVVVCYNDNGTTKQALAFYDCDRNLIEYRDAETNNILTDPTLVNCLQDTIFNEILCDTVKQATSITVSTSSTIERRDVVTGNLLETDNTPEQPITVVVIDGIGYVKGALTHNWYSFDPNDLGAGFTLLPAGVGDIPPSTGETWTTYDPNNPNLIWFGMEDNWTRILDLNTMTYSTMPAFVYPADPTYTALMGVEFSADGSKLYGVVNKIGNPSLLVEIDQVTMEGTLLKELDNAYYNLIRYDDTIYVYDPATEWLELSEDTFEFTKVEGWQPVANTDNVSLSFVGEPVTVNFIRVYHKDLETEIITPQDHNLDGSAYVVQGEVDTCGSDLNLAPPETPTFHYDTLTNGSWLIPSNTRSVSIAVLRGNSSTLETPVGVRTLYEGSSLSWGSETIDEPASGTFTVVAGVDDIILINWVEV